jgi:hypothetical protein
LLAGIPDRLDLAKIIRSFENCVLVGFEIAQADDDRFGSTLEYVSSSSND